MSTATPPVEAPGPAAPPARWWHRAACRSMPTVAFFPEPGDEPGIAAAVAVCARCPVVAACAADAAAFGDLGVRGGVYRSPGRARAHGTRSRYFAGCRCDRCTTANATYQRARRGRTTGAA